MNPATEYIGEKAFDFVLDIGKAVLMAILIILFVALTIASTAELSERQGLSKLISDRKEELIILQTPRTNSPLEKILRAEEDLKDLIYLGSNTKTVTAIRATLDSKSDGGHKDEKEDSGKSLVNKIFDDFIGIAKFSNFLLIAIAVLCCGAFGGIFMFVIIPIKRQEGYWWGVIRGFGIGFAVYLFIRSGKTSYFGDPVLADFNPTSSCFFSVLCGIFFEQTVGLMKSWFVLFSANARKLADELNPKKTEKNKQEPAGPENG